MGETLKPAARNARQTYAIAQLIGCNGHVEKALTRSPQRNCEGSLPTSNFNRPVLCRMGQRTFMGKHCAPGAGGSAKNAMIRIRPPPSIPKQPFPPAYLDGLSCLQNRSNRLKLYGAFRQLSDRHQLRRSGWLFLYGRPFQHAVHPTPRLPYSPEYPAQNLYVFGAVGPPSA
jgi:hypothetical protein